MSSTANEEHSDAERYGKRLAIIVPYRDRAKHLAKFIPHMRAYFSQDKLDKKIAVSIYIIEQGGIAPFNRGKLANCGYALTRDVADYFCFHDVDYLPIWADYSWSMNPARLVWHGVKFRETWETFFGAAVLFDKQAFDRVNGYPNVYWGWGWEDTELRLRCGIAGIEIERRDGTFQPLPHKHAGLVAPGVWTDQALRTKALFAEREPKLAEVMATDGLSNLEYKVLRKAPIMLKGAAVPNAFYYLLDIGP